MDRTVRYLVALFAVIGIGLLGYYWADRWHTATLNAAVEKEKATCLKKIARLEADIRKLAEEAGIQNQNIPAKTDLQNVFGSEKPVRAMQSDTVDCKKVTAQSVAFFQYLDSKSYLIWPGINMRAEELFDEVYDKLSTHAPKNVGEMDNLSNLTRNVTHFYRVLGKDRIDLLKEILNSEAAVVEPAMAVMFTWLTACDAGISKVDESSRLASLYQYAAFFLNTLGGRSYLLRRDGKLRMLINYYALLTLDLANDATLNSYGIDIRPHIDYVFYDFNNQKGLLYRQRYLTHLAALKSKYP